ncbi:hypothetical protein DIC82_01610 [Clostridium beijerinckii]|nr:hypothetical protein DIC82_01610 [Clostridium beijerinckii]
MIYQYPEEFIVPVVYVQDFKGKTFYRCKDSKYLNEGELAIPDEESKEDEMFLAKIDIYGTFQNKDINFLNMDGEEFQKPMIKGDIVKSDLDNESIKSILSDVDEDYANSETLNI